MSLSKEQENFVKLCRLILDVVPAHLRQYFEKKWNAKYPQNKWDGTCQSGQFLLNQIPPKVQNNPRNSQYLNSLQNGNTDNWDPTTLFFVLLYSYLQLIKPCRVKAKRISPLLDSEFVDNLREIRNEFFAHPKSASVSSVDFQTVVVELKNACALFGSNYKKEVEKIEQSTVQNELSEQLKDVLETQIRFNDEFNEWLLQFKGVKEDVTDIKETVKDTKEKVEDVARTLECINVSQRSTDENVQDTKEKVEDVARALECMNINQRSTDENVQDTKEKVNDVAITLESINERQKRNDQHFQELSTTLQAWQQEQNNKDEIMKDLIKDYKTRCIKKIKQWHVPVLKSKMKWGNIIRSFDYELRNRKEYNVELVVVDSEYEEQIMANELFNYRKLVGLAAGNRIELKDLMCDDDQRYFIRGVAGIGKTTLAEWINFAWANNDLYSDIFDLVFLVRCRDLRLYKGKTIDEFWHDNFGLKIEDLRGQGNKILIIVDGIDEIDDLGKQFNDLTILRNLLDKDFDPLLGHSTIITGRPHKEEELMKNQSITGKLRTLSIVGFSESEIKKFVGNFTSGNEDVKREILDALENNPSLNGLSTIPQYLHSICCVLAVEGRRVEISKVTHLYVWVFISFLRQHFQNYAEKRAYEILKDERLSTCIKLIAEVAYNLLLENKIVFDKDQFSEIDNKFNRNSEEKEVLEIFINKKETEYGYHYEFKHLTLHEFFAAIHCFHIDVRRKKIIQKRWKQVFLFVVGFSSAAQRNPNSDIVSLFLSKCVNIENTPDKRSLILEFGDLIQTGADHAYELQLIHEAFEVDEGIGKKFGKTFVGKHFILFPFTQLKIFHLFYFIHLVQICNLGDLLADMGISIDISTFSRPEQIFDLLSCLHLFGEVELTLVEGITTNHIECLKNGIMKDESKLQNLTYWNNFKATDKETFDALIGCVPYIKCCRFFQLNREQKKHLIEEINRCRNQKNFRFERLTTARPNFDISLGYGVDELNSIETSD